MRGKFDGDTGLIVRVEENVIVLFSDLTFHEVRLWSILTNYHIIYTFKVNAFYINSFLEGQ